MPEDVSPAPHQIDHVIAEQHHGQTSADNLAMACFSCNCRKGPNLSGIDPKTGKVTPLFNPRAQRWSRHFSLSQSGRIHGWTASGRATADVLRVNAPSAVLARRALIEEGVLVASHKK